MYIIMQQNTHQIEVFSNAYQFVIDNELMNDAMRLTGAIAKREAVELALKSLILLEKQKKVKHFRGKLKWEGNLEELRTDH